MFQLKNFISDLLEEFNFDNIITLMKFKKKFVIFII